MRIKIEQRRYGIIGFSFTAFRVIYENNCRFSEIEWKRYTIEVIQSILGYLDKMAFGRF